MLHRTAFTSSLTVTVSLIFIGVSVLFPGFVSEITLWVVLASVILVGIPHGAIDHIMAEKVYGLDRTWKGKAKFYGGYLGLMLVVCGIWWVHPVAGMLFFFAISIYHFGQADIEDFVRPETNGIPWYLVRGVFILGLILFSDTTVSYPIMAQAIQADPETLFAILPAGFGALAVIAAVYAALLFSAWLSGKLTNGLRLLCDSILIVTLFLTAGPLIGFAIYFALWHSAGHVIEMQEFLRERKQSMTLKEFYKRSAPFTIISLLGLAFLAGVNHAFWMEEQFIALMFILISVLTLPHMVIVDRMYAQLHG